MGHVFERAVSGRSKCRGCRQPIAKDEWRFGERLANPYGEGEVTHWFHPRCAAYRRPDALLAALADAPNDLPERESLERVARGALEHPRLVRLDGAERAPSGQAHCRHCRELIERGEWRIRLVFHEEGTFSPGGFIHLACAEPYFETRDILECLTHFSRDLAAGERDALQNALAQACHGTVTRRE